MRLRGSIRVPSDKSISHRAVLFAAMAQGTSHLDAVLPSDDVRSSLAAVSALGAKVSLEEGEHGLKGTVTGWGESHAASTRELDIDCGNSGTTTRLLLGILSGLGVRARLEGDLSLSARPMERVMLPLREMGASFVAEDGHLPITVMPVPQPLRPLTYDSPKASAQVKSAILLAGLSACGRTTVTEPARSRDHTERLLPAFGVPVEVDGLTVGVEGPTRLKAHDLTVPADPSSAAFIAVAAALNPGSDVEICQVALNPTRIGAFEVMRDMGCDIDWVRTHLEGSEPIGNIHVRFRDHIQACTVKPDRVPTLIDEVPILALLAAFAEGETVFEGVGELRVKESDRFQAILDGLAALGFAAFGDGDDLHVIGDPEHFLNRPAGSLGLDTHHDHRLAMTWIIAARTFGKEIELDDEDCVSVSWPNFGADLGLLSVE